MISDAMESLGIEYGFATYAKNPVVYPYFVGTYKENDATTEDGLQETVFTINGWTRGSWMDLERAKAKVKALFPVTGDTAIALDGSGLAVSYVRSQQLPTGEEELKRLEITLSVKEWSV